MKPCAGIGWDAECRRSSHPRRAPYHEDTIDPGATDMTLTRRRFLSIAAASTAAPLALTSLASAKRAP